jgi:hypothetical protein
LRDCIVRHGDVGVKPPNPTHSIGEVTRGKYRAMTAILEEIRRMGAER